MKKSMMMKKATKMKMIRKNLNQVKRRMRKF